VTESLQASPEAGRLARIELGVEPGTSEKELSLEQRRQLHEIRDRIKREWRNSR
jgi:hypothetical protein